VGGGGKPEFTSGAAGGPLPPNKNKRALTHFPHEEVPLTTEVALQRRAFKLPHSDPADRFIAASALSYDLVLLTADRHLLKCKTIQVMAA
jgi:PIN domain nuclease of toxin-antitoxin system